MMVLKFPCCLIHCLHHNLKIFHFERMLCYCNETYNNGYCGQIFHFGRVLQSWKKKSCCWPPCCWIHSPLDMWLPQICLYCCESHPHWSLYLSLSQRIFLFGRVYQSWKANLKYIFICCVVVREYFSLGGCIDPSMSNAIFGGAVTPVSLKLAQWLC